jgi:hypothetical protein
MEQVVATAACSVDKWMGGGGGGLKSVIKNGIEIHRYQMNCAVDTNADAINEILS